MDLQSVRSYKDLETQLNESSTDEIRANFKTIQALISALHEKLNLIMEEWNVNLDNKKFLEGNIEQKFAEFQTLLPSFKEELDSMVQCVKMTWNKDILGMPNETIAKMIDTIENLREHGLQQLDAIYNLLRLFANPQKVIDEYKELEKQNPQPVHSSSSGCLVIFLVLIISAAFVFC